MLVSDRKGYFPNFACKVTKIMPNSDNPLYRKM